MSVRKPPVSSSIGIEIKAPVGIELEGDTVVIPKVKCIEEEENPDEFEYAVHIQLSDGTVAYESFPSSERISDFMSYICKNGYMYKVEDKPGRYKFYPPHCILPSIVVVEDEEDDY